MILTMNDKNFDNCEASLTKKRVKQQQQHPTCYQQLATDTLTSLRGQ